MQKWILINEIKLQKKKEIYWVPTVCKEIKFKVKRCFLFILTALTISFQNTCDFWGFVIGLPSLYIHKYYTNPRKQGDKYLQLPNISLLDTGCGSATKV